MSETKHLVVIFLLLLCVFFSCGAYSAMRCTQLSGFMLSPSIAPVMSDVSGLLSSNWEAASVRVECTGLMKGKFVSHRFGAAGSDSGKSFVFEGVSYKLYSTNLSDVFYFGNFVGSDLVSRPLETPFTVGGYAPSAGTFRSSIGVQIRFYSDSVSMQPGIRTINASKLVGGLVSSWGSYSYVGNVSLQAFSFEVKPPSCKLEAPGEVKLKSVNLAAIPTLGNTVDVASFNLAVVCKNNSRANEVSYSMVDVNAPTNRSPTLALANFPGQASGISLQIMDGDAPVTFGAASKRTLGIMPKGGGSISKPMSVRYIRTAVNVRPGPVRAGVTVTLSYQ